MKSKESSARRLYAGRNCHLKDILPSLPDSELMAQSFAAILAKMRLLARPSDEVRQKHIEDIMADIVN